MKHEESSVIKPVKLPPDRVKLKQQKAIDGFKINVNMHLNMKNCFTFLSIYIHFHDKYATAIYLN